MVIRRQSRASGCAVWAAVLVLATCLFTPVHASAANPFADSFASGGKKRPAHRVTKTTKTTTRTSTKRRKPARPTHARAHGKPRPGRAAPPPSRGDDSFAAEAPAPEPERAAPERDTSDWQTFDDAPRARRAAEPEETTREEAPAKDSQEAQEEEDRPPPRRVAPPPRRPIPKKHKRQTGDDGESSDDDSEEDDATPYTAATATQPVIVPRAFTLLLGGTMMGRSFHFDSPLQRESSFPRVGYVAAIETYPLKLLGPSWADGLGLAASYEAEVIGKASVTQTNGMATSTSVNQARWNLDLRYAFELGGYVVLEPDVGLTNSSFTLNTDMPVMASQCDPTATAACIPNTHVLLLQAGAHLRFALGREFAITLDGAFLDALTVKNKPLNEIGYEAGTSATGFNGALGATFMITDFLAVHGELPFTRLTYTFHNPPDTPYKTATETYYGVSVGLAVFTD